MVDIKRNLFLEIFTGNHFINNDVILTIDILRSIFVKINLTAEEKYIVALINKLDK